MDVGGEIDLATAPALRSRVDGLVREGVRRLLVNLEAVGFLDSSGLSALIASLKEMQDAEGELAIVCHNETVLKVFTVTGLDKVFSIHGSLAEAVAG